MAQTICAQVLLVRFAAGGHIVPQQVMVTNTEGQRERLHDPTRQVILHLEHALQ